uniref:Protein artemis n=1 Tax=Steinernema glaseri TaxID=37863 RepID=A0A1I7ZV34_9BILA
MDRIPLDFVGRVVNMMLYNDYYKVDWNVMKTGHRERHFSAFSRLSRPWDQFDGSLQECQVLVYGNVYSIHIIDRNKSGLITECRSEEVDILAWNRNKYVVAELAFGATAFCECPEDQANEVICRRPLSPAIFRRLRNILRRNQRPVSIVYYSSYENSKFEENLEELLPAIHGIGLLDVPYHFKNFMPRLLEIPVNFFNFWSYYREETRMVVDHIVEAMKKGLLRGWQSMVFSDFTRDDYEKMVNLVLDLHSEGPPNYFFCNSSWIDANDVYKKLELFRERWTPAVSPSYHCAQYYTSWFRYIC